MLFVGLGVWLLISPDRTVFVRRLRLASVPVAVILGLFLMLPASGVSFLEGVAYQENTLPAQGLSLARVLPRWLVKALPLGLVAIGALRGRRGSSDVRDLLPFWLGCAIVLLLYPTLAFDYSVPCLFGLIPFALEWARGQRESRLEAAWLVPSFFFLFMGVASTVKIVDAIANADVDVNLIWGHLTCAALLVMTPARWHGERVP